MSKVEILSSEQHSSLKVERAIDAKFGDIGAVAMVYADELPKLSLDFPVFITKNPNTGQFELSALMGFSPTENLFFDNDGNWRAAYVPLDIRRQPFQAILLESDPSKDRAESQVKVGVNVESKRLTNAGEALFNQDGTGTKYLESVSNILGALMEGSRLTQEFLKVLSDKALIEPAKLSIQAADKKEVSFDGLYNINEEKLRTLSDDDVLSFQSLGYLQACYAMIHSLGHMEKLFEWKNQTLV